MAFSEDDKKKLELLLATSATTSPAEMSDRPPQQFGADVQEMVQRHFLDSYAEGLLKLEKKGKAGKELKDELAAEVMKSFLELRRPGRIMESRKSLGMPNLIPEAGLLDTDVRADAIKANSIPDFNRQRLRESIGVKDSSGMMGYKAKQIDEPKKAQEPKGDELMKALETIMKELMQKEGVDEGFDLEIERQDFSDPKSTGPDWVIPSGRSDTSPITVSGSKQDVSTTKMKKRVK